NRTGRKGKISVGQGKIRIENLNKTFVTRRQTIQAVKDVNMSIEEGEFVSLIGPSGCGKSTIIRMIDDLIKPTSGKIYVDQVELTEYKRIPAEINKKIGFIFQLPNLLPWLTVRENVCFPLKVYKMRNAASERYADELIEMAGLKEYKDAYPSEISGGVTQRIGVIRALVHKPEIVFMDEPFGALDTMMREQLDMEILKICRSMKKTVIFITHDVEEAVLLSDRIYVMGTNPGRIVKEVKIELEKERTLSMLTEEKFQKYCSELTGYIGKIDLSKIV
ncbi:MAG: ABC transporter ATP-binding protein, partial [Lachnospiraceae bacterium]|nr:ABC transporter ATP-binding protein [Lachnospiraceae bacterium]